MSTRYIIIAGLSIITPFPFRILFQYCRFFSSNFATRFIKNWMSSFQDSQLLCDFRHFFLQVWASIPMHFINYVIHSMCRKCQAEINANGGHTRFWLFVRVFLVMWKWKILTINIEWTEMMYICPINCLRPFNTKYAVQYNIYQCLC